MPDYLSPVCIGCGRKMRPAKIGVNVIELTEKNGAPYTIYNADIYECPECKNQVTFGNGKLTKKHEKEFAATVESAENSDGIPLIYFW